MEKKCFFFGLDSTFGRPQKRGAEVGAAAILGGMGLFGGIMSSNSQAEANAANLHYSKEENEKNRKFSHDERVAQNEWEADQYYKRLYTTNTLYKQNFNDQQQAAYDLWLKENDPNNLLPAYQKAGLNISALAGDMGSGMISPSSTPVPSAQSPSSGSSSGAPAALGANQVATGGAAAQMISSIGGLIKSLASAGKDNADMQSVLKLLAPKFENMILQNQGLELMNQYSSIQNKYADAFKSEDLRKLTNEADDTLVSAWLKSIQGHYVEEQTITEKLNQVLKGIDIEIGRTKSEQEKQTLEKLKIEAGLWHQNILSQIKVNNAKASESYSAVGRNHAESKYLGALTKTADALRDGQVTALQLSNDLATIGKYLKGNDLKISDATVQANIDNILESLKQNKLITGQQYWQLLGMRSDAEWRDKEHYMQYWTGFFNSASNAISSGSGYYNGSINRMNTEDKIKVQREFNEVLERGQKWMQYSDEEGTIYHTPWR